MVSKLRNGATELKTCKFPGAKAFVRLLASLGPCCTTRCLHFCLCAVVVCPAFPRSYLVLGSREGAWNTLMRTQKNRTCKSPSRDAFACHYPWQRPVVADMASQAAEPWLTSWETTVPPVPAVRCWPGELPYSSQHGFALRGKPSLLMDGLSPSSG